MKYFILILFVFCSIKKLAQSGNDSVFEKHVFFNFKNTNFVINNEYFNDFIEGYTLIGYHITPSFTYQPTPKIQINFGVHAQKYSGISSFSQHKPIYSFTYKTNNNKFIFGTIENNNNHNLLTFISFQESNYTNPIENGFQYRHISNTINIDAWVNWEQYIFINDNKPEIINGGFNGNYIISPNSNIQIKPEINSLIYHKGGQIDTSDVTMQTLIYSSLGFSTTFQNNNDNTFGLSAYYNIFLDNSPESELAYKNGSGVLINTQYTHRSWSFSCSYWNANSWIGNVGNPIYQSISYKGNPFNKKKRSLLIPKIEFKTEIFSNSFIGFYAKSYYDLNENLLDYSFGITAIFNESLLLKKLPRCRRSIDAE